MSLKIDNIYINKLKEINNHFFSSLNIKKMFVLDLANVNLAHIRKVLIVDDKNKAHYLETENDVFTFVQKNYASKKYGVHFAFEILLFLKHARGYDFVVDQNIKKNYNSYLKKYPDMLKNSNGIIMRRKNKSILCQSLFLTINGDTVILIEIELSPESISIKKKKEDTIFYIM
jgi:hypothetical protein